MYYEQPAIHRIQFSVKLKKRERLLFKRSSLILRNFFFVEDEVTEAVE